MKVERIVTLLIHFTEENFQTMMEGLESAAHYDSNVTEQTRMRAALLRAELTTAVNDANEPVPF